MQSKISSLPSTNQYGPILHAFDWSFNTIRNELSNIAAAGYKSIQVSPVQGTKETSTDPTKWWLLYQPTNESIGNIQLGTYDDFKALCSEAKTYEISIIVDVVMNHMAGTGDSLSSDVDSNFKNSTYYHQEGQCTDWNNRHDITQKGIGMPDLNTQNPEVQNKAILFLNQCIDAGADGFRFDAAKHIETNIGLDSNQSWAGNYWSNVLNNLHNKSNLFIYGEILQSGTVDNLSGYESFMNITACSYGYNLRSALYSNDLSSLGSDSTGLPINKSVTFVETHDTYEDGTSKNLSISQIKLGWAIVASRNSSTPLFFARPISSIGAEGDSLWKDADIVAINHFHNNMIGENEYLRWTNNNSTMLIDRGNSGTIIVNCGSNKYINSPTNLKNGTYSNEGSTSCSLTVSNGILSGNIPENSVIILSTNITNLDTVSWSPTNPTINETISITYIATGRPLQNSTTVNIHWGYDGFKDFTNTPMTYLGNNQWKVTLTIPPNATTNLDLCFTTGLTWDNNSNKDWHLHIY
ncbi:alpha-amylase family glycosyl hydrolase [Clostridium sp. SHJSY1]|uniref:alpha-amylase family glycosyl hydrolase n=1 Tax=Clostridium sp. SHJSY1 TaxID=2942483 RepID=UPI0028765D93|nr:alpha-amylase family glycosyl hydrolase [Clostridium sp. SHJSY1]MDS0526139.1 alpha-amylase family glycosyl hydrolase [Clostridium sp. SHJSY1]